MINVHKNIFFVILALAFTSLAQENQFISIDSKVTQIEFSNNINENNLINIYNYEYLYNGGGIAVGDLNNDGLSDLYFISNLEDNHLYLNKGNFYFEDITYQSNTQGSPGFCTGVNMVDVNQDGFLDIYICKSVLTDSKMRENELLINNGNLTFTNQAKEYGLNDAGYSTQSYFFDMDLDGDLDLFLLNHPPNIAEGNKIKMRKNEKDETIFYTENDLNLVSNKLYRNDAGKFKDISKDAGIQAESFGLSAIISDFNGDLYPDIYICNDFVKPDNLFINTKKAQFIDSLSSFFAHSSFSSKGSDYADINNDGLMDLLTVDALPRENYRLKTLSLAQNNDKFNQMVSAGLGAQLSSNSLQLNNGNNTYSDISFLAGIANTDWSWSPLMADFNNDGWKDVFVTNGLRRDITNSDYRNYMSDSVGKISQLGTDFTKFLNLIPSQKIQNFLFKNNKDLSFTDMSQAWNSGTPTFSNGAVYADLNNDGLLDLVSNNINEKATILMNLGFDGGRNNFIKIKLVDPSQKTVYGAKVKVYTKISLHLKKPQLQEYQPTRGYLSSVEPILHFGLGDKKVIEKIEIIWPDGSYQEVYDLAVNQLYTISKKSTNNTRLSNDYRLYKDVSHLLHEEMVHQENEYDDFKREPLLFQKFSMEGPAVAVGDINNDKLDDVFIGGSKGFGGKLFIQKQDGSFVKTSQKFDESIESEDVNALIFDINSDGFNDLYVVTGGNENQANSPLYKDRVYINDKRNNLIYTPTATPELYLNSSAIAHLDIDNDGDLDLFIGGRITPGKFPEVQQSCILKNDKGKFIDFTEKWSEGLSNIGMVTDAVFSDINNDGKSELIIAGEWMPISVFEFEKGKFTDRTAKYGLSESNGWWQSITIADLNSDSIPDIVAGNMGLNTFFEATKQQPMELYDGDFDQNNILDPIICTYNDLDKSYPIHKREQLINQLPMLKEQFPNYGSYAKTSMEALFSIDKIKTSKKLQINDLENALFLGSKNHVFKKIPTPNELQISSIQTCLVNDIGLKESREIIVAGNFYGTDIQFGRLDASIGLILKIKKDNFINVSSPITNGLKLNGDVRKIISIKTAKNQKSMLITKNSGPFNLYKTSELH